MERGCCTTGIKLVGKRVPWNRCIALEYGDNSLSVGSVPLSGIVQCAECKRCYKFTQLARTRGACVWAFGVAHNSDVLLQLAAAYKLAQAAPAWPVFVPPVDVRADVAKYIAAVEDTVWLHCAAPELVLAAAHIVTGVVVWARVGPVDPVTNWLLELERNIDRV